MKHFLFLQVDGDDDINCTTSLRRSAALWMLPLLLDEDSSCFYRTDEVTRHHCLCFDSGHTALYKIVIDWSLHFHLLQRSVMIVRAERGYAMESVCPSVLAVCL